MDNFDKSMKLSLFFGLIGAAIVPVIYEIYANISANIALFLLFLWVCYGGIKFSPLKLKEAFIGITCAIAYSGVLGAVFYFLIHPKIEEMLNEKSVYFQLTFKEQLYFIVYVFAIFLIMYIFPIIRTIFSMLEKKIKSNNLKSKEYIDNAFDDNMDNIEGK